MPQPPVAAQPQVTSAPAQKQQPQVAQRERGWLDFLSKPEVSAALIQFGANMLQPNAGGFVGALGPAFGGAAGAAGRVVENRRRAAQEAGEQEQAARRTRIAERQVATEESRAASAEKASAAQLAQREKELGLEQRKLEEYLIPSLKRSGGGGGGKMTLEDRLANSVYKGFLEQTQYMDEFADDPSGAAAWAYQQTLATLSQSQPAATTPPAEGATPPPAGVTPPAESPAAAPASEAGGQEPPLDSPVKMGDKTYPALNSLTDEQLKGIEADPKLKAEADSVYGAGAVRGRLQGLKKREAVRKAPGMK